MRVRIQSIDSITGQTAQGWHGNRNTQSQEAQEALRKDGGRNLKSCGDNQGTDTVGKKIWRTNGQTFDIISDFRVEKFLIDNISLTETEKTPIIGIRNVKTHYNAFKSDVMFTFYDDINTLEEKVWNLCYNEI